MPTDELLASPYRIMRRVEAPGDSPWPGLLASTAGGGSVLLVDAGVLGPDWPGWTADPSGHVLGPLDIVRRATGHDVALPVCTERLTDFLSRRATTPLSEGERLTVALSIARGVHELAGAPAACIGSWWLTESGQPTFAAHVGGDAAVDSSAGIVRDLADGAGRLTEPLRELEAAISEPHILPRALARCEERLFALAEPAPLATASLAARRARDVGVAGREAAPYIDEATERSTLLKTLVRHVDSDLAELVSQITTGLWRRIRSRPQSRTRRPIIVSVGVAAVVLGVGLMWPTGESGPATAGTTQPSVVVTSPSASPDAAEAIEATAVAGSPDASATDAAAVEDVTAVATALLTLRSACAQDRACLADVVEDPGAETPAGVVDLPEAGRTVTLLDDFGGAAVLRVEAIAPGPTAQLVVLIRSSEKWLLRDVHDIAEQP